LLSKNTKTDTYKTIIVPVVFYGYGTSLLILREELRLRVFENRVLRRIFLAKRDEVIREWGKYITRSLMICTLHHMLWG
jgi:membrane-bound acyltransferase YfiQ involved in biofilm formation